MLRSTSIQRMLGRLRRRSSNWIKRRVRQEICALLEGVRHAASLTGGGGRGDLREIFEVVSESAYRAVEPRERVKPENGELSTMNTDNTDDQRMMGLAALLFVRRSSMKGR